jgi:DNA-binding response OmpR family regulator
MSVAAALTDSETIADLKGTVQELQDRVSELQELIFGEQERIQAAFGLTTIEATIVALLLNRPVGTKPVLYGALYSGALDELPDTTVLKVHICKIRKKLDAFGIEIETLWGDGWKLTPAMKDRLRSLLGGAE